MLKFTLRWVVRCGAVAAVLVIFGCSSSSKSYTLLANLDAMSQTQRIVTAAIDVTGSTCKVSVLTADSATLWTPDCTVNASTATQKSFTIAGQKIDMTGANGSFTVSGTSSLTLPVATHSVATAAIKAAYAGTAASAASATPTGKAGSKAEKKGAKNGKQKPKLAEASTAPAAASAAPAAPVTGQAFPVKWAQSTYPGHWDLEAQNLGYLVQSAKIVINGSACNLDTEFKVKYPAYKFVCIVTSDDNHNFTLIFNPYLIAEKTLSPQSQITLDSEGQSISGNIWDAHGFDGWNPAVPPTWRAASGK